MKHKHIWEPDGGCIENPGVSSQGKEMHFRAVCPCGAHRLKITSVSPHDDGEYVEIRDRSEQIVSRKDTRNWF